MEKKQNTETFNCGTKNIYLKVGGTLSADVDSLQVCEH